MSFIDTIENGSSNITLTQMAFHLLIFCISLFLSFLLLLFCFFILLFLDKEIKIDDEKRTFLSEKSQNEKEETIIKPIDPKIYCKLGHFNLLLGNYAKGTLHCLV